MIRRSRWMAATSPDLALEAKTVSKRTRASAKVVRPKR
jgi:hypothetical protein